MTIIPDGIEPVVAYRSWNWADDKLISHMNFVWEHGVPAEAKCPNSFWEWVAVQDGGMTLEEIREAGVPGAVQMTPGQIWQVQAQTAVSYTTQMYAASSGYGPSHLPNVTLPEGWGYESRVHTHLAPDEQCTCGLYGAVHEGGSAPGEVYGEVHLWGKVIPGTNAHRAQYAYPKCFKVREKATAELLEPYGVPIEVVKSPAVPFDNTNSLSNTYGLSSGTSTSLDHTQFTTMMTKLNAINTVPGDSVKIDWLEDELVPRSQPKKKRWWQ